MKVVRKESYLTSVCHRPDLPTVTDTAANFEYTTQYSAESCRRIPIAIKICHYIFTNVLAIFGNDI